MDYSLIVNEFIDEWHSNSATIFTQTSGTTSGGKPIVLSKADMEISARATLDFLGLRGEGLTFVMPINPAYIGGKMMIVRSLLAGARLVEIEPSLDPLSTLPPDVTRIDLLAIVPAQIPELLKSAANVEIGNIIIGGAPIPESFENQLLEAMQGCNIFSTYGMTETSSHIALRRLGKKYYEALPGVKFETDDTGCLIITHNSASWSPMKTRDIVQLASPYKMEWIGRADNLINTGGLKVSPEQIEQLLGAAGLPGDFYITSRPHDKWGQAITLVIEGENLDTASIMEQIKKILPQKLVPKAIEVFPNLRRTDTGKLRRDD
ncbi:MAG: AMP-binding protein [Muribaculaceae bacterium]|nr:AMP-binding protein [Muribaculaceae bacterium]